MSKEAQPIKRGRTTRKQLTTRIIVGTAIVVAVTVIIVSVAAVVDLYFSLPISNQSQIIFNGSHVVDQTGFTIACDPSLRRLRNASDLFVDFGEQWEFTDSVNEIKIGGKRTTVEAVLVDSAGNQYRCVLTGGAAKSRYAGFGGLPRGARIREVRLYASEPVHCTKVEWRNWNPM